MRLTLALTSIALSGCCATIDPPWKPEASLLTLCDETGTLLTGTSGADIVHWGVAFRKAYEICDARHKRLVEAIPK